MEKKLLKLQEKVEHADHIVIFSGAGISTESGLKDYRSSNGLYQSQQIEYLMSRDYYQSSPEAFWTSFKQIHQLDQLNQYQPNTGHHWVSALENRGKKVTVLTQNIDGLHRKAGSSQVYELHGTLQTATCPTCKKTVSLDDILKTSVPHCKSCNDILNTDVVLFGDEVKQLEAALSIALQADLCIIMGSSLKVGPVNLIPQYVAQSGIFTCLINKEATSMDDIFDLKIYDKIGTIIQELINEKKSI